MAPGEMHEISRTIGDLEASIRAFKETWAQQDRDATEGRRRMHEKLDEMKSEQRDLRSTVAQQTKELAEVKPALKRFEAQRQHQEGQRSAVKLIWMAIVAFATGLGYVGHELLVFFWPLKH